LLSGLGSLLAVPVGLLPAASLLTTLVGRPPLVLPWVTIAVVVLLVPLLATVGAVLVSRREPGRLARAAGRRGTVRLASGGGPAHVAEVPRVSVTVPPPVGPPAVPLRDVVKRFGDLTAGDHLDLEVPAGVCFGLLGPNGAGKST